MKVLIFNGRTLKHNEKINCIIRNSIIIDCVLSINDELDDNGRKYFICHNNDVFDGSKAVDKLGYKYSWTFEVNDDKLTQEVNILDNLLDMKDNLSICDEVSLLKSYRHQIIDLFSIKNGRYKDFSKIESSEKEGMIKLSTENKSIEIKFGRFIKGLIEDNKEIVSKLNFNVSESYIESIYNDYITFQGRNSMTLQILKGEDILKGYTKGNYYQSVGNLATSCMVNKHSFLELYTKNSNISLAVLVYKDKICARCLIWNNEYFDKVYSNFDWCSVCIKYFLKDYKKIDNDLTLNIDFIPQLFPYVDTLYNLDKDKKTISTIENRAIPRMRTTSGGLC